MKSASQFSIIAHLYIDPFIKTQPNQVKRFFNRGYSYRLQQKHSTNNTTQHKNNKREPIHLHKPKCQGVRGGLVVACWADG